MTKETKELLTTIFSDADIVDIDFSQWDKFVSIIAIADHLTSTFDSGRRPIFKLDFFETEQVSFKFRHHHKNIFINESQKHFHWVADECEIVGNKDKFIVCIFQDNHMPYIEVCFSRLSIEELPHKIFDEVTPSWFKPNSPFPRRSVKEIYNRMKRNK